LALIERSALDRPELRDVFYTGGRREMTDQLARYPDAIGRRWAAHDRRPGSAALLLRESISWFAITAISTPMSTGWTIRRCR
jgi:hypothetical protein